MALATGARLGPYEIIGLIGAGGMGEVYRARDARLNRTVAIKIVHATHQTDPHRRRRFEREAQTIATLAHPHICVVHDVGCEQGIDFLVMEYLDGETLATRLLRGPMPLHEVVHCGSEIAGALDAAHRHGVVHRDLKPANVMLTESGVKLLDFGVARLIHPEIDANAETATAAESLTAPHSVPGTLPYIAPEQLAGAPGDERSDIFALGVVLYEMISGRRPFAAESRAGLLAAVLQSDPAPLATGNRTVSPALDRLLARCLAKEPDARWQHAGEVAGELQRIRDSAQPAPSRTSGGPRALRLAVLAGAVLLAALASALWLARVMDTRTRGPRQERVTFTTDVGSSALSPDGRTVAYSTRGPGSGIDVVVQDVGGARRSPVWSGRSIPALSWMPDGSRLIVSGDQNRWGVWIVPVLGGTPTLVSASAKLAAASPDGGRLALATDRVVGFSLVSLADGREASPVTLSGFERVLAIDWHARTNRIVLMTADEENTLWSIWSVAPDGSDQSRLLTGNDYFRAICTSPVADVVYAMRQDQRHDTLELLRVPMYADPRGVRVLQTGLPITSMAYRCTVSADGRRLLYGRGERHAALWQLDPARATQAPAPLTRSAGSFFHPAVSPDGRWVAATRGSEFEHEIVKVPIGGGDAVRIGDGAGPAWSPDGRQLAFTSRRGGSPGVWISGVNGEWAKEVKDSAVGAPRPIWLPDGRVAWQTPDRQNYRIRDLATGREEDLLRDGGPEGSVANAMFSPRGDQVVFDSDRYGRSMWLMSWPGRQLRALGRDLSPLYWSADGTSIVAVGYPGPALVRVSAASGKAERIGAFPDRAGPAGCDRAARTDSIVCSLVYETSDAWMMQKFDPDLP